MPEEPWTEVRDIVQEAGIKTIPKKKKCKKEKRRDAKGKEEKERYTHLNAEFQRIARRDKKAFLDYKQNEKTALRLGENNSKRINKQKINLKNIQANPPAQLQKNKWPSQKMGQRTQQAFLQRRHTDG